MKKYPNKKQTIVWHDIRSPKRPEYNAMLFILVGEDIVIGGYDVEPPYFWDGSVDEVIPTDEVTAWAYLSIPDFEE